MEKPGKGKIAIQFILLIAVVVIFSFISKSFLRQLTGS
jgi:hypothetical protein